MPRKREPKSYPWLTPTGVPIPTADLKQIVASWVKATWEEYLDWFETSIREKLVRPEIYDQIGNEQTESIFEKFRQNSSQKNRRRCERELRKLPPLEAEVLRQYFLEGRTEVEIAFALNRSRTGISRIKIRALSRLKRGNSGDEVSLCQFMRGEDESSIWDEPLRYPLKEDRPYSADAHQDEFDKIKTSSVRAALLGLSDTAQRILYLRHWCGFSVGQIARRLRLGVNVVDQIDSASISKIKRAVLDFELGTSFLGGD